jgi:hypothetical protein
VQKTATSDQNLFGQSVVVDVRVPRSLAHNGGATEKDPNSIGQFFPTEAGKLWREALAVLEADAEATITRVSSWTVGGARPPWRVSRKLR